MRKSFETTTAIDVAVRLAAGEVELACTDTAETVVEVEALNQSAEARMEEFRVELQGARLIVEAPDRGGVFGHSPEYRARVRCPSGSGLESRTASADIRTTGRLGRLDVKSASGDVRVDEVDGICGTSSASGDIRIGSAHGPVEVGTTSGDVEIGRAASGLRAHLTSGDLRASEVEGGADVNTVSGDIVLESVGPGSIRLRSVSGDVEVGVRQGCDVWMDVKTMSGDTSSDLESREAAPADRSKLVEIDANTLSGDVRILRASPSPAT